VTTGNFCSRERLIEFFFNIKKHTIFKDEEIEIILNELDPY
jgi:hypothetical protein